MSQSSCWNHYLEQNQKVMLFVSDFERKEQLRQEIDRLCPKADVVIVASQEKISTGQVCHGYVMVQLA
jgi:hypothetical protein